MLWHILNKRDSDACVRFGVCIDHGGGDELINFSNDAYIRDEAFIPGAMIIAVFGFMMIIIVLNNFNIVQFISQASLITINQTQDISTFIISAIFGPH